LKRAPSDEILLRRTWGHSRTMDATTAKLPRLSNRRADDGLSLGYSGLLANSDRPVSEMGPLRASMLNCPRPPGAVKRP
jgi:hypothetical protein